MELVVTAKINQVHKALTCNKLVSLESQKQDFEALMENQSCFLFHNQDMGLGKKNVVSCLCSC